MRSIIILLSLSLWMNFLIGQGTYEQDFSPACKADFTFHLDTLNPEQNTYIFTSTSKGDPTHFFWSFEDGAKYTMPQVAHHFSSVGSYRVCLRIEKRVAGVVICADSICLNIETARYFDLGGHLFIGDHPINNPVSTGDTGIAYLYRKTENGLIHVASNYFTYLGYYAFPKVLNGSYIVRMELTKHSRNYNKFIPTYFPDRLRWTESNERLMYDSSSFSTHVSMFPAVTGLNGPGKISGFVVEGEPGIGSEKVPDAQVILYDHLGLPLTFCQADESGEYHFDDLPYGSYSLYVEMPGKYSRLTNIWLDQAVSIANNTLLGVFSYDVTGMREQSLAPFEVGHIFPNPAGAVVYVPVRTPAPVKVHCEITDMHTMNTFMFERRCQEGFNMLVIPLEKLNPGLHTLSVTLDDGGTTVVRKIVKL